MENNETTKQEESGLTEQDLNEFLSAKSYEDQLSILFAHAKKNKKFVQDRRMSNASKQKVSSYDYKTVRVRRETETMLCDAYDTLGWEIVDTSFATPTLSHVNVNFKRNRKIQNKAELMTLQNKIDGAIGNIEKLRDRQKNAGIPEAITMGTVGALTLGGGMSMIMTVGGVAFTIGGIALGVVGIAIGLFGWLVHNLIHKKKLKKIEPSIETEFTKLSDLCDEAINSVNSDLTVKMQ